ncbi:helix-turn-helix domain-containing protein [Chitinophaga japonensis]|uniref:AraC-like DNA-binding protein n=1 Tax=Chitinophaga japonensis TaxID=104662 RepID=A0A562TI13_CHIJA|nr:AraC family transcriptional regulator [Chitinophaga japonensis]TWI92340.1 AraC-like DNA-binding protein [Chitinophaga japonensis]
MPSRQKQAIPVHSLEDRSPVGLEIHFVDDVKSRVIRDGMGAHRDDHHIFILLETGFTRIMVDFQVQEVTGPAIFYVLPGQVHQYIDSAKASGWFVAASSLLVGELYQPVLNDNVHKGPAPLSGKQLEAFSGLCRLLEQSRSAAAAPFSRPVLHSLVAALAGMTAGVYTEYKGRDKQALRGAAITAAFRQLLAAEYKTMKSPADYARKMNRSLSYLNETVKASTGFPVSYWIQQETMQEARRLLYYTRLSVKEIAYQLGYDDPTYFSRLFKKVVGLTPGEYRDRYRE